MSLSTDALKLVCPYLEPQDQFHSAQVCTEWKGVIYTLWEEDSNRLNLAQEYTKVANRRLSRFWLLTFKENLSRIKDLPFPASVFSKEELMLQASYQFFQLAIRITSKMDLAPVFAQEHAFHELKALIRFSPNFETIHDFILLTTRRPHPLGWGGSVDSPL